MSCELAQGDLLDQRVDAIVNAWNRNVIPWWLLLPQGVSGAIKRRAGLAPFRELGRLGPIPLGGAGAGSGGVAEAQALAWIEETLRASDPHCHVRVIRYRPTP